MSSLLLDWDADSLQRKYQSTYCNIEKDGVKKIYFVSEVSGMNLDSPALTYVHEPYKSGGALWSDGGGTHFGAIHEKSGTKLKIHDVSIPVGHLQGLATKAKYFTTGYDALYFGARRLKKSFKWGINKDDWYITRVANAALVPIPKILELVMSSFTKKENKEYLLLSEEVAVIGGAIKILNVTVGFLDGTHAKVKNAAVGKILSELEPTWTISYW